MSSLRSSPSVRDVEEAILPLQYTAALLETLQRDLNDPIDYTHLAVCYDLTKLGVSEGVARLHRSIDQLLSFVAANGQKETY